MILSHRSYYCVSHFFLFRPLCFISPFPRFISSPRAAPAKVASLLISPRAQSAMSPRSQEGCNCELQKKNKWWVLRRLSNTHDRNRVVSHWSRFVYRKTDGKRMWLRLPMCSFYLDIARLWWIVIIRSGGDEPFKHKSIWLSGCQVVRDLEK